MSTLPLSITSRGLNVLFLIVKMRETKGSTRKLPSLFSNRRHPASDFCRPYFSNSVCQKRFTCSFVA